MRAEGRSFRLSPRVLELGRPYLSSLTLPEIAAPHLREFVAEVRESSSVAILDGSDIVYVAHAAADRIMSVAVNIGTRDPAFATSLGRALIAGQSDEGLDVVARDARARADHRRDDLRAGGAARRDRARARAGLRVRRPGARGRPARARRAAARRRRRRGRRGQRRRAREPLDVEAIHDDLLPRLRLVAAAIEADLHAAPRRCPGDRADRGRRDRRPGARRVRARDRLRAVAAARDRRDPRLRRREPRTDPERRREGDRARPRGRAPVRADARRARLHAVRAAARSGSARACSSSAGRTSRR